MFGKANTYSLIFIYLQRGGILWISINVIKLTTDMKRLFSMFDNGGGGGRYCYDATCVRGVRRGNKSMCTIAASCVVLF